MYATAMIDIEVISDPAVAVAALDPIRSALLAELAEPASAAILATRLGLPRQKVNYHLRALEACRLVEVADERQWGGLTERLLVLSAKSFVVSPEALGAVAADPKRSKDQLAASYLIALGARIVREVGDLWKRARKADKQLATLSIDTEIRFASPAARAAFTRELTQAITELVSRYHDANASGGRNHRLVIVSHPFPQTSH
ncbi:helix-turn-helix domain-containing protein [Bradyrhizobium sp. sBnM-33]|uniref:winged helix-turn-helix domain-containing protein n=1 Tax=Bradyrhizobium sp. sBnM-33 TaxID=2831780 RepID=UPI0020BFFEC8|nr:helix-turn-helix domain-containing protein [Bradyrhizobium sp. sBnM-33]WOH51982.1 helix-turn-helix domain-containing protein [Bradyrhizobium sp. sBnM-33]